MQGTTLGYNRRKIHPATTVVSGDFVSRKPLKITRISPKFKGDYLFLLSCIVTVIMGDSSVSVNKKDVLMLNCSHLLHFYKTQIEKKTVCAKQWSFNNCP